MNVGRTGGMEGFTEPPNLSDLSCVGALPIRCNPKSRWRTISGICNNPNNYHWGAMSTKFARFLPPQYSDGLNMPRGFFNESISSAPTPNGRSVAVRLVSMYSGFRLRNLPGHNSDPLTAVMLLV